MHLNRISEDRIDVVYRIWTCPTIFGSFLFHKNLFWKKKNIRALIQFQLSPLSNRNKNPNWNISSNVQKYSTLLFCFPTLGRQICTAEVEKWQNCTCIATLILEIGNFCCKHLAFIYQTLQKLSCFLPSLKSHTQNRYIPGIAGIVTFRKTFGVLVRASVKCFLGAGFHCMADWQISKKLDASFQKFQK